MCMLCAGASHSDLVDHYVRTINTHGWAIVGVTGSTPWTYTVGLAWDLQHPELVVVGASPTAAAGLLHEVVRSIEQGAHLSAGASLVTDGCELRFGHVDHRNLIGEWFAQWHPIARAAGHGTTSLRALQVRIAALDPCDGCWIQQRALERRCTVDSLGALTHDC